MNNFAFEFTPEMDERLLAGRLNSIERSASVDEGRARAEADAGGLMGQAQMGSKIGWARANAANAREDAMSHFALDTAGLRREERLTQESRAYGSSEAQKLRDFQEKLANMGYAHQRGMLSAQQGYERVQGQQGMITGGLFQLGASAIGSAGAAAGGG